MGWGKRKEREKEYNNLYYYTKIKGKKCPDCGKSIQKYSEHCVTCQNLTNKKDLNQLFEDFLKKIGKVSCGCGCGELIIIKTHHRYIGIPKYISGHNSTPPSPGFYEKEILDNLEKCLTYKIIRQYKVMNFYLDGYCPALNLAIEIDGVSHSTKKILEDDKEREQKIKSKLNCQFFRIDIKGDYNSWY